MSAAFFRSAGRRLGLAGPAPCRRAAPFLALAVAVLWAAPAPAAPAADSIYLKNGRVIHTDSAAIVGDRVVFRQYGGTVSLPLSVVDRVVEDDVPGPDARPSPGPGSAVPAPGDAGQGGGTGGGAAGEERRDAGSAAAGPGADEGLRTREYWQRQQQAILDRMVVVEERLARLPEIDPLLARIIIDGRILWVVQERRRLEARLAEEEQLLADLRRLARRAGVPPGWLRDSWRPSAATR